MINMDEDLENKDEAQDDSDIKTQNTIIVKIDPSVINKKINETRVNKVYVVPNKVSKESIRKKFNDPTAEVIDVSSLYESVNSTGCNVFKNITRNHKGFSIKNENKERDVKSEDTCEDHSESQGSYFDNTIHITSNQKEDFESEFTEHEICDVGQEMVDDDDDSKQNLKLCHIYEDDDSLNDQQTNSLTDIHLKQNNVSWANSRKNKDLEERMKLAIEAVLKSNMSVKRAAHVFGIRYSILVSKINKAGSSCKSVLGADPALTEKEELALVDWIKGRYKNGCPVKKIDLVNRVADIVSDGRSTRFKDGTPGEKWFMNFMSRNPSVAILGPATRCDSREAPSKQSIMSWFSRCENHLQAFGQAHLVHESRRIGSVEELTLCLLSSKTKVSKANGSRDGMLYFPQEKSGNIMVLLGACADGTLTPPMPVFSCRKPPPLLIQSIPSGWGIGLSKDGNINKEVLHSYFKNILIPWLSEEERLPFILFIDKLKSFLSVDTADFCAQKGLLIYNFHPNSNQVLQPLYKSVIEPVKKSWGALSTHRNDKEALLQFCPILNQLLLDLAPPYVIVDSFNSCGIHPFDPKAPDYSKCLFIKEGSQIKNFSSNDYAVALEVFENMIGKIKTEIFQETLKGFKLLKAEDSSLYKVWHKLISRVDVTRNAMDPEEYKHEKIIRGANRKLPRPEMYLMVVDDNEGSMQDINNFNSSTNAEDVDDPSSETELEIDINVITKTDDLMSDKIGERYGDKSSAFWKDKYRSREGGNETKDRKKIKEERKLERRIKKERKMETLGQDEISTKRLKKAIGPRYCTQCLEEKGKLIKCMVCKNHIHFECMMEEEQQILSDLYEDQVAFDYICPGCS